MPLRPFSRDQDWLLPPSLEDLVPADHPARFVAAFVDGLDGDGWRELGIEPDGEVLGAPAYHPRALLSVWVYGFMTGVRSSRKLEGACRDQLPYLWLTGCQRPDHNTLHRFYQANRGGMRQLFRRTVRTAVRLGLVDLALQAVDGSKIAGSAARRRSLDEDGLARLLARAEEAIAELEARDETGGDEPPVRLPDGLAAAKRLREQVAGALRQVRAEEGPREANLTDGDARLVKGRGGFVVGYNAQAVVSPLDETAGRGGMIVTAAEVTNEADDQGQLVPMVEAAQGATGRVAGTTLADGGYHSGANLAACQARCISVLMAESQEQALKGAYHKDRFGYDASSDCYLCPRGFRLHYVLTTHRKGRPSKRIYRASASECRACPAFGECTRNRRQGRSLEVGEHEGILRSHRALMESAEAKASYSRRKELVEPTFGIMKDCQGARRFLLRGLSNVRAEWNLLAATFNLGTLFRVWKGWPPTRREGLLAGMGS